MGPLLKLPGPGLSKGRCSWSAGGARALSAVPQPPPPPPPRSPPRLHAASHPPLPPALRLQAEKTSLTTGEAAGTAAAALWSAANPRRRNTAQE